MSQIYDLFQSDNYIIVLQRLLGFFTKLEKKPEMIYLEIYLY